MKLTDDDIARVCQLVDDLTGIQWDASKSYLIESRLPDYEETHRGYLTIAIGCTGGQHRSVYLVERLAAHFRGKYPQLLVRHNALPK